MTFENMPLIKILALLFLCPILLLSCRTSIKNELEIKGGIIAKGDIRDSIYNGLIKFYNKETGKLIDESNYLNGKANGKHIEYYDNGKVSVKTNFINDKPNGYGYCYDSLGNLVSKGYQYYGIRAGASIEYKNNNPYKYYFYSLENDVLFNINYDTIGNKGIGELATNFFFINSYKLMGDSIIEYRIYNINPPKYNFKYSLVTLDEKKQITSTVKELTTKDDDLWYIFKNPKSKTLPGKERYAIQINVKDSINHKDWTALKFLQD